MNLKKPQIMKNIFKCSFSKKRKYVQQRKIFVRDTVGFFDARVTIGTYPSQDSSENLDNNIRETISNNSLCVPGTHKSIFPLSFKKIKQQILKENTTRLVTI